MATEEIKLDGYRAVAVKSDRGVNLFSRRHKSFNHQYPYLVEALSDLPEGTVVDGEIVALDELSRPNFISWAADFHPLHTLDSNTHKRRNAGLNRGRGVSSGGYFLRRR